MARTETTLGVWHDTIMQDADAKPLTREQEAALWPVARSGDLAAKLKLLKSQWRLCYKIARRYEWTGCDIDDLIGWGMIGLLTAFHKFEPDRGNKFSTVSILWIRQAIGYEAPKNSLTCKVPASFFSKSFRDAQGIDDEFYERTKYKFCRTNNFKQTRSESGDEYDLVSMCTDHEYADTEIDQHIVAAIVRRSLDALTEPRRSIVRRRMNGESMQSISEDYGVTKQRIQQLEAQGKHRMREWIEKNHPNLEF